MKASESDAPIQLDAVDRRILAALREDGRITNADVSKLTGISAPSFVRRVRAMEDAGVIHGHHADPVPHESDWEITFFAIVGLDSKTETALSGFESLMASWPEVRECYMLRGGGDFLLRLAVRDQDQETLLTQMLTRAPNVTRVQTLQTIRAARSVVPPLPVADAAGEALTSRFRKAVGAAIDAAHVDGLAVTTRRGRKPVEIRPDRTAADIAPGEAWSPTGWKQQA